MAIVGRPNVGKSTLLNHLLGKKISITSKKAQTTRHRLLGIKTVDDYQIVYVDTPGLHQNAKRALNRYLNRAASHSLHDVDVIVMVVDCLQWDPDDDWVVAHFKDSRIPVILAINKIDKLEHRASLLPLIEAYQTKYPFQAVIPISAQEGEQLDELVTEVKKFLPESPFFFPPEQITDRNDQFIAAEAIREKLTRTLGQELPYRLTVTIEAFANEKDIVRISAIIWVDKESQKPIIIGKKGEQLKKVGTYARLDLEKYFEKKVYLQLWIKIKTGWSDDEKMLRQLGYEE